MTTSPAPLAERVRVALAAEPSTREVRMFGGLSFMVNEKLVVCVLGNGDLLVRVAPERDAELAALPGATPAEMGAGRVMGAGWIAVAAEAVAADEDLSFWIDAAMAFNPHAGRRRR